MSSSSAQASSNSTAASQSGINYISDYVMVPRASLNASSSSSTTTSPGPIVVKTAVWKDHSTFTHSPGCTSCSLCASSSLAYASSASLRGEVKSGKARIRNGVMKTTITTANTITVGTSAILNTALALSINGANEWSALSGLYDEYMVHGVRIEINAVRPLSSAAGALVFWDAYDPTVSAGKTYDKVADYSNSKLLGFNATHCLARRSETPLGEVNTSNEVINKGWVPCSQASNMISGTYLLSTTSVLTGSPLDIYYKVVWDVSFRLRIGS